MGVIVFFDRTKMDISNRLNWDATLQNRVLGHHKIWHVHGICVLKHVFIC